MPDPLGPTTSFEVLRTRGDEAGPATAIVATEVPLTLVVNGTELATLMCSPTDLEPLCAGFLLSAGVIDRAEEILSYRCDTARWEARLQVRHDPDPELLSRRLFTSGCGRGVLYASAVEIAARHPLHSELRIHRDAIAAAMGWMQRASELYRASGGVHTATLCIEGALPTWHMDDVGRHNAVDKVIGRALLEGIDLTRCVLLCSGRTSSDMLHKAKRAGIPISASRGAPTHQAVLQARAMGLTIAGFVRGSSMTVYSHAERVEGLSAQE
jgi:FdhD protein